MGVRRVCDYVIESSCVSGNPGMLFHSVCAWVPRRTPNKLHCVCAWVPRRTPNKLHYLGPLQVVFLNSSSMFSMTFITWTSASTSNDIGNDISGECHAETKCIY